MRHKFLTVTVATFLIGLVSGQQPFGNGFQSYSYASAGNGPRAPGNYDNRASFISNPAPGIPSPNVQSNPAAGQANGAANPSFFPQIPNQFPNRNIQLTNLPANTANSQLSADSIISSIKNNPLIKQFLPRPTNINPSANGAHMIQNNQNGFLPPFVFGSNPLANVKPSYSEQTGNTASQSSFPQINNQPPVNNLQYANSFSNPAGPQVSLADSVMSSIANNPVIKQILQSPVNTNPITNGAQLFRNSQNRIPVPYTTGSNPLPNVNSWSGNNAASASSNPAGSQVSLADSVMRSIENNPVIKQILQSPANTNPVRNGVQLNQNSQNRFPVNFATGYNPSPNGNPWPGNNAASSSFNPQITYQPQIQSPNSFINSGNTQPSADSIMHTIGNNPLIKQYLPGSTNSATNGAQLIQNSQNGFPHPPPNSFNPLLNGNPSDKGLSSLVSKPITKETDTANQRQVFNQAPNPIPDINPAKTNQNSPVNIPLIKKFLSDPENQQLMKNRVLGGVPNSNASYVVQDLLKKIPVMKQFLDNPANQQLLVNRVPDANSSVEILDFLEKNPLAKQFLNDPKNHRVILNKVPWLSKPKRRHRRPGRNRPKSLPKPKSLSSTVNHNTDITGNYPNGNRPISSPTISSLSFIDDASNNPTLSVVPSIVNNPSTPSALNSANSFPDYSLPSDVPIEYPRSDFPDGFFKDMLKSLETDSKSVSSAADKQPKKRRKCKVQRPKAGTGSSSESTAAANAGPTTILPTDGADLVTLNNLGTIDHVTDSMASDSSKAGTKLTTIYPSDTLKQFALSNTKVINSTGTSKAPSTRKWRWRKKPKVNVTDVASKIPSNSDSTSAIATSQLITPQIASSDSAAVFNTNNTNQNSSITAVDLSSIQPTEKKKHNETRFKPKSESGNLQKDLLKGQQDILPSVKDILNLSNAGNNNTDIKSSGQRQKYRKCRRKKERMKASSTKGPTAVSTSGPTDTVLTGTTMQNVAVTDSPVTNKYASKATTVGSGPCVDDKVWYDCMPLNNSCTNVARGNSLKNFICEPGCYCADDFVRDVNGKCVDPDDCADPVCKDEDYEEMTDCLIECNRCEDDCHPCQIESCVSGCDCKDGYKRNDYGTCVLDIDCPPCPSVISD